MHLELLTNSNVFRYSSMIPEAFVDKNELLGVVCLDDDQPLGIAVVDPVEEDKCLNIQWLYVLPEHRRGGVGSLLLEGITDMAQAAELDTVDVYYWASAEEVADETETEAADEAPGEEASLGEEDELQNEDVDLLLYDTFEFTDRDELSDRGLVNDWDSLRGSAFIDAFLLENGFVILREKPVLSFSLSDIISSEYVAKHNKNKNHKKLKEYVGISFEEISDEDETFVISRLKESRFSDYIPFCRRDLSFIVKKDGTPAGCILITKDPDERTLTVMAFQNFGNDPICAAKLIVIAGDKVLDEVPSDYRVCFVAANEGINKIVGTILVDMSKLRVIGVTTHAIMEL